MIKLIASDLDGTLLDGEKRLPEEIFSLVEELYQRGVLFAPASGRQAANLEELFAPVFDKVVFLCENGALVRQKGRTLYCNPVPDEEIKKVLDTVRSLPHLLPMLCGTDYAYIEDEEEPFRSLSHRFYTNCKNVRNLDEIIGKEKICKIAIFDTVGAAENCMKVLPQRIPELRVIQSGFEWVDVSAKDANKGEGLKFIQQAFSFTKEECVAFGDHMNDYEMLLECGRPFVPENAFPLLKERFHSVVPPHTEGGVITQIKQLIRELDGETV